MENGWIGVDLDATLAEYDEWKGLEVIGNPIPLMQRRVLRWLAEGKDVRIFTARVSGPDFLVSLGVIQRWCQEHLGQVLPVTCCKDSQMVECWDDRAVQVVPNTGLRVDGVMDDDFEPGDIGDAM